MIRKFCLTLAVISTAFFSIVSAQQTAKVTASGIGYLEYLPQGYHSNSNKYPVVISLHGIKEKGTSSTDSKKVLADLPRVANVGLPKYVKNGTKYPFILVSPQLKSNMGMWTSAYVMQVINHVKKTLRIDDRRIYLTGLSLGGFGVWRTAGDYPDVFAAIVSVCAGGNAISKAAAIAASNLPIWAFHGSKDGTVSYQVTTKMINAINSAAKKPNPLAKLTILQGMDHAIWDRVYKETDALEWMLKHRKGSAPPADNSNDDNGSNKPPVARAGADRTIILPANALEIQGTAHDSDGKIASLLWTKVSGGTASLSGTVGSKLKIYNLKEGTYVFRLTAKDNDGATKSDDVMVYVKKSGSSGDDGGSNQTPVVNAGPDRVLNLPTNEVTIQGNATDKDGKIVSYEWAKTYGKRASFSGANTSRVRIYNLEKGVYIFRLRAKDDDGAIKEDYFKITVAGSNEKASSTAGRTGTKNSAPVAYSGPDRVLTLPTNSISIKGTASDKDGKIVSYLWIKTYGKRATLSGAQTSTVKISNLERGVYIFRLTVRDDDGALTHDYFKITVKDKNVAYLHLNDGPSLAGADPVRENNTATSGA